MRHDQSTGIWLYAVPPTARQTQIVATLAIALLVSVGVCAPFADRPLPKIDSFIPTVEGAIILTYLITAIMLLSQVSICRSYALLALAGGYLFTALITVSHLLTFPGAFSPTGLLGAGTQSAPWLFIFSHCGLAAATVVYALLKSEEPDDNPTTASSIWYAIRWSIAIAIGAACGLTILATLTDQVLPSLFLNPIHAAPLVYYALGFDAVVCAIAIAMLWNQRRSVLDQWLMLVMLTSIFELVSLSLVSTRFTVGWYAGRLLGIVTSTIVLAVLVRETTVLYGRMARSNALLLRERDNRLLTVEALLGAIRHEMGQPLAAAALDAETVGLLLNVVPPQLDEARAVTAGITAAIHRGVEILDDIRNLFGTAKREAGPIDMNDVTLEALRNLDKELRTHRIATRVELASELPPVVGLRGQLQEVIVNLIQNAIDAMQTVGDRRHELQVKTAHNRNDAIKVTITDTGPGIDTSKSGQMFEAFFTTKPHGMGLGLAICRMIIERHGGQITVFPASPHGTTFEIILPRLTPLP